MKGWQEFLKNSKKIFAYLPLLISLFVLCAWIINILYSKPEFVDYNPLNDNNRFNQEMTVNIITELNKFLISIATALFGVAGFFLTTYKKGVRVAPVGIAYVVSLIILGIGYVFAFDVYAELTTNLSQNALGVKPGFSMILYYLQNASILFGGASITLMSIFVYVFFNRNVE